MTAFQQLALVALGSACGGLARWGVGLAAGRFYGGPFPAITLTINLVGSFLLGWLLTAIAHRYLPDEATWLSGEALRLAIGVGFCGSFTTFSTLEFETHQLLSGPTSWLAWVYVISSFLLGLIALRAGIWLAEQ